MKWYLCCGVCSLRIKHSQLYSVCLAKPVQCITEAKELTSQHCKTWRQNCVQMRIKSFWSHKYAAIFFQKSEWLQSEKVYVIIIIHSIHALVCQFWHYCQGNHSVIVVAKILNLCVSSVCTTFTRSPDHWPAPHWCPRWSGAWRCQTPPRCGGRDSWGHCTPLAWPVTKRRLWSQQ